MELWWLRYSFSISTRPRGCIQVWNVSCTSHQLDLLWYEFEQV